MSDTLREIKGLEWLRKSALLPQGSAARQLNGDGESVARADRTEVSGNLQDWFGGSIDANLYEEALGLGSYSKTLSVLSIEELPDNEELEEELAESWTASFKR